MLSRDRGRRSSHNLEVNVGQECTKLHRRRTRDDMVSIWTSLVCAAQRASNALMSTAHHDHRQKQRTRPWVVVSLTGVATGIYVLLLRAKTSSQKFDLLGGHCGNTHHTAHAPAVGFCGLGFGLPKIVLYSSAQWSTHTGSKSKVKTKETKVRANPDCAAVGGGERDMSDRTV